MQRDVVEHLQPARVRILSAFVAVLRCRRGGCRHEILRKQTIQQEQPGLVPALDLRRGEHGPVPRGVGASVRKGHALRREKLRGRVEVPPPRHRWALVPLAAIVRDRDGAAAIAILLHQV